MPQVPVKLNQELELNIGGYNHEGDGVGRHQNFTVFVSGALKGEQVRAKIIEVRTNFARARVLGIIKPAPHRVKPQCRIYTACGGCQMQHLDYLAQLEQKRQRVVDAIERIGGLKEVTVHPVLGMKLPWGYRNKVQYPFGVDHTTLLMGFYRKGSHRIVPTEVCLIQPEIINKVAKKVKALAEKYHVSIYDEQTGVGLLRHVLIKAGIKTGDLMVVFITNGEQFLTGEKIAHELVAEFPTMKSVVQNINTIRGNVILGDHSKVLLGVDTITDRLGKFKFKIAAESFFQVNPVQTEVLYNKAVEFAGLTGEEIVIDAYCGVGSLTLFLSQKAKKVYGVEVVAEAIKNANHNAELNEVNNVQFLLGETEKVLPTLVRGGIHFDVAVLDPPRSGCETVALKSLADNKVGRIIYVSCNPETLARDLKVLSGMGYVVEEVQPVDMFPHTYHVECVARVGRK